MSELSNIPVLPTENEHEILPVILMGKDEMNLSEFPIARLGRNDTRLSIKYHGQTIDKTGGVLEQTWIVSGNAEFGLPTEFAERVLVALMSITAREHFASRKVPFTRYRILKMLGLTTGKRNYNAVKKALAQLVGVTIYSQGAFWDKEKQKRVTVEKGFHLLEDYWLKNFDIDDDEDEEGINGYIVWGERFWKSFKAGYIKNLDLSFYYGLENTLARRLYRFLDKRMHYQDTYQIDVFELAARLGMKTYRYPSDVTSKLKPAFKELQARGYLTSTEVIKVGKFTRVKFVRTGTVQAWQATLWDEDHAGTDAENDIEGPESVQTSSDEGNCGNNQKDALAALYVQYGTSEDLKVSWQAILQECAASMPSGTYQMLADSALLQVEGDKAVIAVNPHNKDWIARQMRRKFLTLLSQHLGTRVREIDFVDN